MYSKVFKEKQAALDSIAKRKETLWAKENESSTCSNILAVIVPLLVISFTTVKISNSKCYILSSIDSQQQL